MTVEERMAKLEEQMIVQGELLARFERRVEAWISQTEQWINSAENRFAQLEVLSTAVLERLDRFMSGQGGKDSGRTDRP